MAATRRHRPAPLGRRVEVDGLGWQVVELGADPRPPLLLLHGYLAAGQVWDTLAPELVAQTGRRVLIADLPGCGYSDRPGDAPYTLEWLRDRSIELLDTLEIEAVVPVGHSLGGGLALHLAAHAPAKIAGLVLIAPLCFATPLPRILAPASRRPGVFKLFFRSLGRPLIVPAMLRNFAGVQPAEAEELARRAVAHLDAPGGWDAATRMGVAAAFRSPMEPLLEQIRAPALVVWGDRDRVHPAALGQRLANTLDRARTWSVAGCGHNPHLEQPAALAAQVADWLET